MRAEPTSTCAAGVGGNSFLIGADGPSTFGKSVLGRSTFGITGLESSLWIEAGAFCFGKVGSTGETSSGFRPSGAGAPTGGVAGSGAFGSGTVGSGADGNDGPFGSGADGNDGPPGKETGGGLPGGSVYGLLAGGCCPGDWANTKRAKPAMPRPSIASNANLVRRFISILPTSNRKYSKYRVGLRSHHRRKTTRRGRTIAANERGSRSSSAAWNSLEMHRTDDLAIARFARFPNSARSACIAQ